MTTEEALDKAIERLAALAAEVARLEGRVEALERLAAAAVDADPNAPYAGFLSFRAKARAHDERRKA